MLNIKRILRRASMRDPGQSPLKTLPPDYLLSTNDPLSEEQKGTLQSELMDLELDFLRITGRPYVDTVQEIDIRKHKGGKECLKAIRIRKPLLSCMRSLPLELWQRIFFFVVFYESYRAGHLLHDEAELRLLCSVSASWRWAALNHHILWSQLPALNLYDYNIRKKGWVEKLQNRLELYLARSGSMPLVVDCSVNIFAWTRHQEVVQQFAPVLLGLCHRWGDVSLNMPFQVFDAVSLPSVRGKVPSLSRLELFITLPGSGPNGETTFTIDCFSVAPKLEEIRLDIYQDPFDELCPFEIQLPWSQLKKVSASLPSESSFYKDVMEASPSNLQTIDHWARTAEPAVPVPVVPRILPHLTCLRLVMFTMETASFIAHLDLLTLPALTHLTLPRCDTPDGRIYRSVRSLLERSVCSLEEFSLDGKREASKVSLMYFEVLTLCPKLTDVDIAYKESNMFFDKISLDRTSLDRFLPHLKVLRIGRYTYSVDGGQPTLGEINVEKFMRMVKLRTVNLDKKQDLKPLDRVYFYNHDSEELHRNLTIYEAGESRDRSEDLQSPLSGLESLTALAVKAEDVLETYIGADRRHQLEYIKVYRETDRIIQELESVSFEKLNSTIFARRNIPYLLTQVSQMTSGNQLPLGDRLLRFQSRTKKLLNKWKPYLLRDVRASPYVWRYWYGIRGGGFILMEWWNIEESECQTEEDRLWESMTAFE
ncbi:hypothetical protein D9611_012120 [Ephemerocybe angulata]|uniref:F-box domain-containing protein n=1 Tax=Ephemerocybe angulata TaxID=980116 RepID=A0A8H5FG37_9AGAR|nr:hypothetical protein D9611_012120 [Tulosesus angulatus]